VAGSAPARRSSALAAASAAARSASAGTLASASSPAQACRFLRPIFCRPSRRGPPLIPMGTSVSSIVWPAASGPMATVGLRLGSERRFRLPVASAAVCRPLPMVAAPAAPRRSSALVAASAAVRRASSAPAVASVAAGRSSTLAAASAAARRASAGTLALAGAPRRAARYLRPSFCRPSRRAPPLIPMGTSVPSIVWLAASGPTAARGLWRGGRRHCPLVALPAALTGGFRFGPALAPRAPI
jgi:hypothetical protein